MGLERKLIVVLEDDPNSRVALMLLLEDWGYASLGASDANDALAQLGGDVSSVIAILSDYNLGSGRDGVTETRALLARGGAWPVLVISGSMRGKAGDAAKLAGFQFLAKPVNPVDIKAWLDSRFI